MRCVIKLYMKHFTSRAKCVQRVECVSDIDLFVEKNKRIELIPNALALSVYHANVQNVALHNQILLIS